MTAVIAAFVSIGCIALGAFMTGAGAKTGERGQALAWYVLAFAGGAGPITLIAAGVVAGLLLIAVAICAAARHCEQHARGGTATQAVRVVLGRPGGAIRRARKSDLGR